MNRVGLLLAKDCADNYTRRAKGIVEDELYIRDRKTEEMKDSGNEQQEDNQMAEVLAEIKNTLRTLRISFDTKIKTDAHKERMFDNMHQELTDYRNGVNEQQLTSIALEIIQVIDILKKNKRFFGNKEYTKENYRKLLTNYEGLICDLEDILYRQSIEPYEVDGMGIDVKRQKIVRTVTTTIESENNQLAEKLACGYEKNGKVIRPERVIIKKYVSEEAKKLEE